MPHGAEFMIPMALECKLVKFNEDGNVIGEIPDYHQLVVIKVITS